MIFTFSCTKHESFLIHFSFVASIVSIFNRKWAFDAHAMLEEMGKLKSIRV